MKFLATLLIAVGLTVGLNSCTTNPATGKSQVNALSEEKEISLGNEAAPQFLSEGGGELPSPTIVNYVRGLGMQLAQVSERKDLPWEFHVLDSKVINAFALPGGKVFISRGLLERMGNEAQLAAVLGHEVGHVTALHIGQQMAQAMGVQIIAGLLGTAGEATDSDALRVLGAGGQVGGGLYLLKFGRDQESEADMLGIRYMTRLGYNPIGMMQLMDILKGASGGGSQWQILATHPDPELRYNDAARIIMQNHPTAKDPAAFKYNEAQFQQVVIAGLKKLPPARAMGMEIPLKSAMNDALEGSSGTGAASASGEKGASAKTQARPLTPLERAMLLAKCNCHPGGGHQPLLPQASDPR
ncbi:MAG: M48 family metallopeptidase [Phycisphaeraceae bacterium]